MSTKINIPAEIYDKVCELVQKGYGSRKIASMLGYNRPVVQRILKELDIKISKNVRSAYLKTEKHCSNCELTKPIESFYMQVNGKTGAITHSSICKDCNAEVCNYYRYNNLEKRQIKEKEYRKNNKAKINTNFNTYIRERKNQDPAFKLRRDISSWIANIFSKNGSVKDSSLFDELEYSSDDLKKHIESQFEPWMNWHNKGKYDLKTWNDNDQSTWKWQLDHIIPQSDLPYLSMKDDNFKKCWALENLRPLSAKQNNLDGVNRVRHKKD